MRESLVGHEAKFTLPCEVSIVALLMRFIEELLMVEGSDINSPERVEEEVQAAIEAICDGGEPQGPVEATMSIVTEGVELRLSGPEGGAGETRILVRQE